MGGRNSYDSPLWRVYRTFQETSFDQGCVCEIFKLFNAPWINLEVFNSWNQSNYKSQSTPQ